MFASDVVDGAGDSSASITGSLLDYWNGYTNELSAAGTSTVVDNGHASGPASGSASGPASRRYIWVDFSIDMIDIGFRRFSLSAHYASKITRVRLETKMSYQPIIDISTPRGHGGCRKYCLPNVKEAQIDLSRDYATLYRLARKDVTDLVCGAENVVFEDQRGLRLTLAWVLANLELADD